MRVAIISKSFTKGGSASGAFNLANALVAAGCEVFKFDAYETQRNTLIGVVRNIERIVERVFYNSGTHCLRVGPAVFDLCSLYRQYCPDIIQLCDVSGNVIRFNDLNDVPCPVVHRMSDFWPYHGPCHYSLRSSTKVGFAEKLLRSTIFDGSCYPDVNVAPSQWLANHFAHGCPEEKIIRVIRNAVDLPVCSDSKEVTSGVLRFGFISNSIFDPRKGFDVLPSLLGRLAMSGVHVALHLHGRMDKKDCPKIPGVEVVHHGLFCRDELKKVYSSFDVLLCPSRQDNSPNVLCEAMAYGCPVIAQSGTGMDSYITSYTGFLIDFNDHSSRLLYDFKKCCESLSLNYEHYSLAAKDFTKKELSPKSIGRQYVDLYYELIEREKSFHI